MCGIAGILTHRQAGEARLDEALAKMQEALRRRGPDDAGLWHSKCKRVRLAHTRLAILDLTPAGHQPMLTADGRHCIVFNGEIYNFMELRAELERGGVVFQTRTDTEVLLRLYERDGSAMVERLRGMFALAVWDAQEQRAFLARDPLGIKPLYYVQQECMLAFASEVRALQKAGLTGHELDGGALRRYFESGSVAEPQTLLKNVRSLPAGHTLTWAGGHTEMRPFWRFRFDAADMGAEAAVSLTRDALLDSVRHHFVSDVPVGVFLSGGIDSTAVLALSIAAGQRDLETFSIGVDDAGLDESSAAARTAAHFGTRHHELRLDAAAMSASFPAFLASVDQPSIDGFNTFTVAAFARAQGMKVVLSGLGGDELFGGYPSFQRVPRLARLVRRLHPVPGMPLCGALLERWLPRAPWRRAAGLLRHPPSMTRAWRAFRGVFTAPEACALAARYTGGAVETGPKPDDVEISSADERDQISALELGLYMRNQLLKDSDVMSMAHGLELRVPLVDRCLFEAVARIPAALRLQPGKRLLVDAVPEIPRWISQAPKRGFLFPYEKWLASEWGGAFQEVAARLPVATPSWYQLWSVFMLERWLERV
ncbi:asparagine synthase (glutamine-hydrolyzing) [Prosthecobacter sp.]|uniref:asparagine synthase (glutamine-hydrolyzing) n=1 Tax=Prosthecobacter sp. TaxID=1965333 RepID=UPI003783908B